MFRATADFTGSKPTISIQVGDFLSSVHAVDDNWYIGHNDRTGETGAFPALFVESLYETNRKPLSVKETDVSMLPEKPMYANLSKQIQKQIAARALGTTDTLTKPTPTPLVHDLTRLRNFQPKPSDGSGDEDSSRAIESRRVEISPKPITDNKGETMQRVRFESINIQHSISNPDSESCWQNSSFEDSNQFANYDGYYTEDVVTVESTENFSLHGKLSALKASTQNLITSERGERRCIKAILGLIGGLVLGACIFVIYRYIFGYTIQEVGISVSVITLLMCTCLALSSFLRHVMLLVIPNFFTGTGRAVMLAAIFALIVQYPVSNISHNARETGRSMSCIIDIAVNQSRTLEQELKASFKDISEYVEKQEKLLKESTQGMHSAVDSTKAIIDKIDKGASNATEAAAILRQECSRAINDVKSKCQSLCAVAGFPLKEVCKDSLCSLLEQSSGACDGLKIDAAFSVIKDARKVLQSAVDYFDVDIEVRGYFHGDVNTSTQASAIQSEVEEDIGAKLKVFHSISSIILKCLPVPLLLFIFVQSFWYLRNYLAKDGYDNVYITSQFRHLDKSLGKNCILPLKEREQNMYVNTRSMKLNKTELSYCWTGLVQVLFHLLICVFITLFDYALYHILRLVKQHGGIQFDFSSDSKISIQVQGTGPAAEFYRIMVQGYDHDSTFNSSIDIEPCLPNPQTPTDWMIPVFIFLYFITVTIVILRAYGMRLRRKCAANYCPEQEMARIDYLHKKIKHKRIGFLKFIRQQIMSAHKESEVKNRLSFSTWLIAKNPLFEKILPEKQRIECTSCEEHETSFNQIEITRCTGTTCDSRRCSAAYCRECLEVLQNTCPLCSGKDDVRFRE